MDRVRRRTRRGLLLLGRAALGGAATAAGAGAMAGCAGVGQSGGQGASSARGAGDDRVVQRRGGPGRGARTAGGALPGAPPGGDPRSLPGRAEQQRWLPGEAEGPDRERHRPGCLLPGVVRLPAPRRGGEPGAPGRPGPARSGAGAGPVAPVPAPVYVQGEAVGLHPGHADDGDLVQRRPAGAGGAGPAGQGDDLGALPRPGAAPDGARGGRGAALRHLLLALAAPAPGGAHVRRRRAPVRPHRGPRGPPPSTSPRSRRRCSSWATW